MENQEEGLVDQPTEERNPIQFLIGLIGVELILIFFAFIQPSGGAFHGGFKVITATKEITQTNITYVVSTAIYAVLTVVLVLIAVYRRHSDLIQEYRAVQLSLSIMFGISVTGTFYYATSNYILMFLGISFIPIAYYYYLLFGEVGSFLGNRVIIFALRRSIAIFPMFVAISAVTFFGIDFIGDAVELATARVRYNKAAVAKTLAARYGLTYPDGTRIPVGIRYLNWFYDFFHGNFGISYDNQQPVQQAIKGFMWYTIKLQGLALIFSFLLSIIVGMVAAYYHRTPADSSVSAIALLGLSMPIFVSGILAIIVFGGMGLGWFPVAGGHGYPESIAQYFSCRECLNSPGEIWASKTGADLVNISWWGTYLMVTWYYFYDAIRYLVLPLTVLTFSTMATFSRLTRSTMLEVMKQDYILAARANGLSERDVLLKHALRNVLLPLVTYLGISIGTILAGAPITESVFSYPGLGFKFIAALQSLDVPILMTLTMIITIMILMANMLTDIAYTYLDPRISL